MSDQPELDLLKQAERALMRLSPPLLISGPVAGTTSDTAVPCCCSGGAMGAASTTKKRIPAHKLVNAARNGFWSPALDLPYEMPTASDGYRRGDNREATCRERHRYMLRWVRTRIREEQQASA